MSGPSFYQAVCNHTRPGRPLAIVTITKVTGSTPREPGAKMLIDSDGLVHGTIGGGNLEHLAIRDGQATLVAGVPRSFVYPLCSRTGQCCGGSVETFVELINQGPTLYIFGSGHVGLALARTLQDTPFNIVLIDQRSEWNDSNRLSAPAGSIQHVVGDPLEFCQNPPWRDQKNTYAVVMTHSHELDMQLVATLLKAKVHQNQLHWLGLIGSKTKWDQFKAKLRKLDFSDADIAMVRCPVGIDIGGKSPQEVAISIAAEIIALHHQKTIH